MNARPLVLALLLAAGCGSRTGLQDLDGGVIPDDAPLDLAPPTDTVDVPVVVDVPVTVDVPVIVDVPVVVDVPVTVDMPVTVDVPVADVRAFCGNGIRESGEECDLGARNVQLPAFALSQPGRPESTVRPLVRRVAAATFYNYSSASAHTGFEAVGTANVMLYVNAVDNDLGLIFVAGRDADDGTRPSQGAGDMEVFFRGVPALASIAVSDDVDEFTRISSADLHGRWSFTDNTDGGAVTRLPWDTAWRIALEGTYRTGVSTIRYVDGDARTRPLILRDVVVLEHRVGTTGCNPDCRVPRCGDAYVDSSERCDDGNTRSGDGCAADCQRIE